MASRLSLPSWLQWQLLVGRIDRLQWAALGTCLIAASLQWLVLPGLEKLHAREQRNNQWEDAASRSDTSPNVGIQEERFRAFRERLVDHAARGEVLKTFFTEAAAAEIPLQQGDYALIADTEGDFAKLQISLPAKGTYPQIRSYLQSLLANLPALSLDEVSFRRDSVKNQNVEARIRLTLYVKGLDNP